MLKAISSFIKSKNAIWIFVVAVVLFIIWALTSYSNNKVLVRDNMYSAVAQQNVANNYQPVAAPSAPINLAKQRPAKAVSASSLPTVDSKPSYDMHPVANPEDLLPQDKNSQWASLNPVNNGNPQLPDLLQAGALIGLDPISNTLKNPTYDLRSDPIIPKQDVGPWNISTYEPDLGRVPFEIGAGGR
jgi:hypothetical protein